MESWHEINAEELNRIGITCWGLRIVKMETRWWFQIFLFSALLGEMIQFDYCNIFHMG